VQAARYYINETGIPEMRVLRDMFCFQYLPEMPSFHFYWNPSNTGPLYFLICLTAGVVIPSLRCVLCPRSCSVHTCITWLTHVTYLCVVLCHHNTICKSHSWLYV
jgi:hypothetical protein